MSSGQDVSFSEDKVAQGQQLTNKLWNAARLILLGQSTAPPRAASGSRPAAVEDRWILSRLERARLEVAARIDSFDFSHAALALYDFIFTELCDWYLELVKPRLRAGEPQLAGTLVHVLTETVALAHPLIPFLTEEIYSYIPGVEGLLAARVRFLPGSVDEAAEDSVQRAIAAVQALRRWRDLAGVKAGATLSARLVAPGYEETGDQVARLARVSLTNGGIGDGPIATVPIPGGAVEILSGAGLDLERAQRRLAERRSRLDSEIERVERKLGNEGFVAKAPSDVVAAEREKLKRMRAERDAI
jgi:valyl-tRNA synthetase